MYADERPALTLLSLTRRTRSSPIEYQLSEFRTMAVSVPNQKGGCQYYVAFGLTKKSAPRHIWARKGESGTETATGTKKKPKRTMTTI